MFFGAGLLLGISMEDRNFVFTTLHVVTEKLKELYLSYLLEPRGLLQGVLAGEFSLYAYDPALFKPCPQASMPVSLPRS